MGLTIAQKIIKAHLVSGEMKVGEEIALRNARKIVHDYLKGRGFPSGLRAEASALQRMKDLEHLLAIACPAVSRSPSHRGIAM